jgi:hypothetical protein
MRPPVFLTPLTGPEYRPPFLFIQELKSAFGLLRVSLAQNRFQLAVLGSGLAPRSAAGGALE